MVHAMGPMGIEGLFRQACEVTLRLMRDQREPLMRCAQQGHINPSCFKKKKEKKSDYNKVFRFLIPFRIFPSSVLKTFLHDPLVEWGKQAKGLCKAQANESGEIVNEKVCAAH